MHSHTFGTASEHDVGATPVARPSRGEVAPQPCGEQIQVHELVHEATREGSGG
jgi:hypothetical protein